MKKTNPNIQISIWKFSWLLLFFSVYFLPFSSFPYFFLVLVPFVKLRPVQIFCTCLLSCTASESQRGSLKHFETMSVDIRYHSLWKIGHENEIPAYIEQGEVFWEKQLFMAALCNRAGHIYFHPVVSSSSFLWPPYVIGGPLYFCPVVSFLLSIYLLFFPRLISAAADWMSTILLQMAWP